MSLSAQLKIALVETTPIEPAPTELSASKSGINEDAATDIIQDTSPADQMEVRTGEATRIEFPVSFVSVRLIRTNY